MKELRGICSLPDTFAIEGVVCYTYEGDDTMSLEELRHKLLSDCRALNLPVDEVDLYFRPFSKTYYGRYFPVRGNTKRPKIYLYPYENSRGDLLSYELVLDTAIHEFCHHIQYAEGYTRVRGVMHDTKFWAMYTHYINRAKRLSLLSA